MKHLRNEAEKIVNEWNEKGFLSPRGKVIKFYLCRLGGSTLEDYLSDNRTEEEYESTIMNYTCFEAPINLDDVMYDFEFGYENPYTEFHFDIDGLEQELIEHVKNKLGKGVKVTYNTITGEFECWRIQ